MTDGAEGRGDEIRTPDQRLRVFVSSTLAELADERAAVARAISSLRLTPVMFELGARPHPPQELYRAYLAQSDIFIGLYWQRYGWIGPGMDISGLEDELRLSGALPQLLYMKTPAPEQEPRLAAMIADIQSDATASYRSFRTPRELGRLVRDDLATMLSERFSTRGPATSPAQATGPRRHRASLPATSTSLVGRERDVEAVCALLESSGVRLVTLTGAGGIGKTRLAVAVGARLDGPDRVTVFVPLAAVEDVDQVLPRVAAAVGAVLEGSRRPLDVLVEHFEESRTLLVLDNLEQVVDVALELDELLTSAPTLQILATSRTVLRLRAEREYPVTALAVPAADSIDLVAIAASSAVQLFVERAAAVRYDFALTSANAAAIVEICRRLDGLPLAIELAAARTRLLDPTAVLDRLEHVLDALGSGPVDLPERQRTLRATVEWSIGLLDEDERRMLTTLAVFVDGWTLAAAVHVTGLSDDRTLDLLDALAGHSLVSVIAAGAEPRFRMLVAVRELAGEHLALDPERDEVARRHAEHFASLVDAPTDSQAVWAARLRADEENMRVAIRWFFDHDPTPLPHLMRGLWLYWQIGDRMPEGRAWIEELRPLVGNGDAYARAEVLFTAAVTAVEVGDDDVALAAIEEAAALVGEVDDPQLDSSLRLAIAWTLPIVEDVDGARRAAADALDGFRRHNEPYVAFAALTVGMLAAGGGDDDDVARTHLVEVDELGQRFDNHWLQSAARSQLATLAVRAGDLDQARQLLASSIDASRRAPLNTLTLTFMLIAHAQLALAEDRPLAAATALGAADGLRRRAGVRAWPLSRQSQTELTGRVVAATDPEGYRAAVAAGTELHARDALALITAPARAS